MIVHLIVVVILVAAAFGLKRRFPLLAWALSLVVLAWGGMLVYYDLSPPGPENDLAVSMLVYAMAGLVFLVGLFLLAVKSVAWLMSQERPDQDHR